MSEQEQSTVIVKKTGLAAKMSSIMGEIDRIRKNGRNEFMKYNYATSEDVSDMIREHMAKHGLAFVPSMERVEDVKVDKGRMTRIEFSMLICDSESGEEIKSKWFSEAQDSQDKGINKCATAAVKYFLMKTFLLSSSDELDSDADAPLQSTDKQKTVDKIKTKIAEKETPKTGNGPLRLSDVSNMIQQCKDEKELQDVGRMLREATFAGDGERDAIKNAYQSRLSVIRKESF